jgi:hypothetical protein
MAGYLDQYGAGEEERNRIVSRLFISLIVLGIVGALAWYVFEFHHEEGLVKAFVAATRRGDFESAYRAWGCTPQKPCGGYPLQKFMDDWGPKSSAPDPKVFGVVADEACNNGVIFTLAVNAKRREKLWVTQGSDEIDFSPYPVCPHKSPYAIMRDRTLGWLRKPLL